MRGGAALLLALAALLPGCLGDGLSCDYIYTDPHATLHYARPIAQDEAIASLHGLGWDLTARDIRTATGSKHGPNVSFEIRLSTYEKELYIEVDARVRPPPERTGTAAYEAIGPEFAAIRDVLDPRAGAPPDERYVLGNPCRDESVFTPTRTASRGSPSAA